MKKLLLSLSLALFTICITQAQTGVVAAFGWNQIGNCSGFVSFQDTSFTNNPADTIISALWDFGDGNTTTTNGGQNVGHFYTAPGTYIVTLTVTGSITTDSLSQSIVILQAGQPQLSWVVGPDTCGQCVGNIAITVTGGTPPYSYAWNTGATTPTATGLCGGNSQIGSINYGVTVTDANNCVKSQLLFVSESVINPNEIITYPNCGTSNGSILINPSATFPPVDVLWSTGDTTNFIGNIGAGMYIATLTDATGCVKNDTFMVTDSCGAIKGKVYVDVNSNGAFDGGDVPKSGVGVSVDGTFSQYTNNQGNYSHVISSGGTYEVSINAPNFFSNCSGGSLFQPYSFGNPVTGIDTITVATNTVSTGNNFGLLNPVDSCGQICGTVWNDTNQNGIMDPGEPGLPGVTINFNNQFYTSSSSNGSWCIELPFGTYNISTILGSASVYCNGNAFAPNITFPGSGSYNISIDSANPSSLNHDFGVHYSQAHDAGIYSLGVYSGNAAGQCFNAWMDFKIYGAGNTNDTCVLRIEHDSLVSMVTSSLPVTHVGETFVEWVFPPGTAPALWYCMTMTWCIDSAATAGQVLHWEASYICGDGSMDVCPNNDVKIVDVTVVSGPLKTFITSNVVGNSLHNFSPQGEFDFLIGQDDSVFSYYLMFQNVLEDTLYDMVFIDSLPEEIQITSVTYPFSSGPLKMDILPGNVLKVVMDQLSLPDSGTDWMNSFGFVQFNAKTVSGLPWGTIITNRGQVYLNDQAPLMVEVANKIEEPSSTLPVPTSVGEVVLYPNPSEGIFKLLIGDNATYEFRINDLRGMTVAAGQFSEGTTIDLSQQSSGVYLIHLYNAESKEMRKLVIQR